MSHFICVKGTIGINTLQPAGGSVSFIFNISSIPGRLFSPREKIQTLCIIKAAI